MLFADLLGRFESVSSEADGGYSALCPAHQDSRPSLRIWRGADDKVRLTCRAGCDTADVIAAVRLGWGDLFQATGPGATVPAGRPQLVPVAQTAALAAYVDRASLALGDYAAEWSARARDYLAKRFGLDLETAAELGLGVDDGSAGKDFPHLSRAYRSFARLTVPLLGFDGTTRGLQGRDLTGDCPGRWVSLMNPKGFRWAPYGVMRGQGGYGTVLVTEGPGDGLTAVAVGYDAVVVRGASLAGSPELVAELAEGLRGQLVIICGDNDRAGNGFSQRLAEGLTAHGVTAYALDMPHQGDDLTDWRARDPSGFPAELHRAVKSARPVRQSADVQADERSAELATRTGADSVSRDQGSEAARILSDLVGQYGESDAMNAHALVAFNNGTIRHAAGLGFYTWNGRIWVRSDMRVRQEIHRMGAALVLAGQNQLARGFTMTSRIDALLTELCSVPNVSISATDFDDRPDLLNFANGTVDLRTGLLRPHDQADLLTYALDIDYNPQATCPRWEAFLEEIFPGMPDMPAYIQRMVGYGITGHTTEQAFSVLWGKGANGKSVLVDTLTSVFRAISRTTPFSTFEERKSGGIPNDIAALRGARLVMASEGESGKPMSESILKRVTGKDMISARFLRQEFFEFRPSFLLLLATNHKPKFKSQDEGLWRRVKLLPFTRWFAPAERDPALDRKLLAESEGIAAWAVRGAVAWYREGLRDPQVITGASQEYRETSDPLAGFLPGVLEWADDAVSMSGNDAFNSYLDWCEAENLPGRERWTRQAFYSAMEERGAIKKRTKRGISLGGLRLADESPEQTGPGIFGS
ncbi:MULTISPECIES: phage/plasmid primase, P4 family [Streptomyces]|uniref:phage/plasmid primase, P4 family n=1 Tax=Streptomyces TaxID=1883 RepID=UPI001E40BB20|nr:MULTISPECIES: phage/plasmid primase, P4 family [Streptomyces]UFQ15495.1 phage/plasmid primase, P4 family [Streptomyces huasconensis]WCL85098.1 phage/plasmid primase, P4 family [Streptomyces sp. JCM 35825]